MLVKRFAEAKTYEAPNHYGVVGLRLQGFEPGGPTNQWVGYSQFLPGGGAGPDSTPFEKVYVVLDGEMTVIVDGKETVLGADGFLHHRAQRGSPDRQSHEPRLQDAGRDPLSAGSKTVSGAPTDPHALFSVKDKVALITGASGAFGAVAAETLASANAKIALAAGKPKELAEVAAECRARGAEVEEIVGRPNSEAACDAMVAKTIARFGRLDILVVASGKNDVSKIVDMAPERFLDVMDANVTQSWLIARAAGKQMLAQGQGGKVILMSSARGLLGHPAGYSAYCASKSAVDGLTKALGCEWGPLGITVNAIAPTVFRSPLTEWMFADDERAKTVRAGFLTRVPKGRLGEPTDLAGPLLFLASAASDFYTGHILYADGGYTAG